MANAGNIYEIEDYLFKHPDALARFENVRREVTSTPAKILHLKLPSAPNLSRDQNVFTHDKR